MFALGDGEALFPHASQLPSEVGLVHDGRSRAAVEFELRQQFLELPRAQVSEQDLPQGGRVKRKLAADFPIPPRAATRSWVIQYVVDDIWTINAIDQQNMRCLADADPGGQSGFRRQPVQDGLGNGAE